MAPSRTSRSDTLRTHTRCCVARIRSERRCIRSCQYPGLCTAYAVAAFLSTVEVLRRGAASFICSCWRGRRRQPRGYRSMLWIWQGRLGSVNGVLPDARWHFICCMSLPPSDIVCTTSHRRMYPLTFLIYDREQISVEPIHGSAISFRYLQA